MILIKKKFSIFLKVVLLISLFSCSAAKKEDKESNERKERIASLTSETPEKSTKDQGILGAIENTVKSSVDIIGKGVNQFTETTLSAVGIKQSQNKQDENRPKKYLRFSHVSWGEIPQSETSLFEDKTVAIIKSLKELVDFRSKTSQVNYSKSLKELASIDFDKENVLVFFTEFRRKKIFSNVEAILVDDGMKVKKKTAIERKDCYDYVRKNTKGLTYQILVVEKFPKLENQKVEIESSGEFSFCSSDFGNFAQLASSKQIPFTKLKNLESKVASKKELTVQIFKNIWGGWDKFKQNYCEDCVKYENKVGFPYRKTLISLQKSEMIDSDYSFKLNKIKFISGFWYLDVTARRKCSAVESSQHQLFEVMNKDLPDLGQNLALDRVILPGPFIPIEQNTCD